MLAERRSIKSLFLSDSGDLFLRLKANHETKQRQEGQEEGEEASVCSPPFRSFWTKANHVTNDMAKAAEYAAISKSRTRMKNSTEYKNASEGRKAELLAADKQRVLRLR